MSGRLSSRLENIPIVRKRFRKGNAWVREPLSINGGNSLQTTRALELNYNIIRVVLLWMDGPKLSVKLLEPEARLNPFPVMSLFKKMQFIPEEKKQPWIDSWSIRTMLSRQDWAEQSRRDRLAELDNDDDLGGDEDDDEDTPRRDDKKSGTNSAEEADAAREEQEEDDAQEDEGGEEEEEKEDDPIISTERSESYHMQEKRDRLKIMRAEIEALQQRLIPPLGIIGVWVE
eukprot:s6654_g2.t1